jgi:hypothetical protein
VDLDPVRMISIFMNRRNAISPTSLRTVSSRLIFSEENLETLLQSLPATWLYIVPFIQRA